VASSIKNLSTFNSSLLPQADGMRFGFVVSSWNTEITESMFTEARETLLKAGCRSTDIIRQNVPGSFELPLGAKWLLTSMKPDAVICIGCVIQGETRHFDFICHAVSTGIMQLGLEFKTPVIFGVLTTNTIEQAKDRSGGKHGNKGVEAAVTALEMVSLRRSL
jgi:6,7-dimethyl-8-ribityllumazine synthase